MTNYRQGGNLVRVPDDYKRTAARIGICAAIRAQQLPFGKVAVHTVLEPYVTAVSASGAVPLLLPCVSNSHVAALVEALDAVVLTGGPDVGEDATRDDFETNVLRAALDRGVPVLAICRGLQLANVMHGGTLHTHIDGHLGAEVRHVVDVVAGSELEAAVAARRVETNSLHHQAVDALGAGLRVTARAEDATIEALEAPGLLAVQWHPELEHDTAAGAALFTWLAAQARERSWS